MEKVNVFVIALPTMTSVVDKIKDAIEDVFEKPKVSRPCFCCEEDEEDFTPRHMRVTEPCGDVQPWGVGGKKADENLRFGAEFAVDEPRCEDYDCRWEFEDDHAAYDRFVSAGEDCVERGLARPEGVTPHRCEGIRKPIGCPPPMNLPLIGETHWWECPCEWDF